MHVFTLLFFWQDLTCACASSRASSAADRVMLSVLMPRGNMELAGLLGCLLAALHPSSWECKHVTLRDRCLYGTQGLVLAGFAWVGPANFLHAASVEQNKTPGRKLAGPGQARKSYSYPAR